MKIEIPENQTKLFHELRIYHKQIYVFQVDDLISSIHDVLNNTYQEKIHHLSRVFRSRPMSPSQRAAYWVDHVLRFGGDHLHTSALDMPWYQYLMLDIALFLMISSIIACCVLYKVGRIMYNRTIETKKMKIQ